MFMSSYVRHCSLPNKGQVFRRAFMPQFSCGVVWDKGGNGCVALAVKV